MLLLPQIINKRTYVIKAENRGASPIISLFRTVDEPRFLVVVRIAGKHWAGIITYRAENNMEI